MVPVSSLTKVFEQVFLKVYESIEYMELYNITYLYCKITHLN